MECSLHLTLGFDLARLLFAPAENFLAFRAGGNRCCYGCCPKMGYGWWALVFSLLISGCRRGVFEGSLFAFAWGSGQVASRDRD
jgi:hypothetical protein